MRILYVSSSTVPSRAANSVHVMKMCQAFAGLGHEVRLLTMNRPAKQISSELDDYAHYGVQPSFDLRKLPFPGFPGGQACYAWAAKREADRWKPDLVYGRYFPAVAFLGFSGSPVVLESHERIWERGRTVRNLVKKLFRSPGFQRLVVISNALKEMYLEQKLLPESRICVAHDAADPAPSCPPAGNSVFKVGYLGGVYPGRGIELLLECAGGLPEVEFHFVGGTRADLEQLTGTVPGPNVTGHGYQPPERVPQLRCEMDVLLAPYQRKVAVYGGKGDTSAFMSPLKIIEYMASGRPMICSDLPVLREVLHPVNALLVDPDDREGWVEAIRGLREDPERAAQIGKRALQDFEHQHTWDIRAQHVLEACESCT